MMLHRHFADKGEPPKPKKITRAVKRVRGKTGKAAAYAATRNLYADMIPAVKSLLCNADVDKVFFLIEDDAFPEQLPDCVECVNVSGQEWFKPNSPNYGSHWTYMALLRMAYSKLFPEYDKMLSLDIDTLVVGDISGIWQTDMTGYYVGAVPEYEIPHTLDPYYNVGVMLMNLDYLRETGMDDELIKELNLRWHQFPEQDTLNWLCENQILTLPTKYNDSLCCGYTDAPGIVHYCGWFQWQDNKAHPRFEYLPVYRSLTWNDVARQRKEKYGKTLTFSN